MPTLLPPRDDPTDAPSGRSPTGARHLHLGTSLGRPSPDAEDRYQLRRERRRRADALAGALARAGARTTVVTDRQGVVADDATVRIARIGTARRGGLSVSGLAAHLLPLGRAGVLHLHVDGLDDLLTLSAAGAAHRGRLVLHVHGSPGSPLRNGETARTSHRLLGSPLESRLARQADLVVVGSDRLAEQVEAAGASSVAVIPPAPLPPPELHDRPPGGTRLPFGATGAPQRRVVSVGPLTSQRRPSVLVDLLAGLPPDVELRLLGTGPERTVVDRTARALGLESRVQVRPNVTWAGLLDELECADVLTSAALVGEDPGATLLAMATDVPVVATAVEGLPRLLTDGVDGWLRPPLRVRALGAALDEALARPELARVRAASARRRVAARGWDAVAAEVLAALDLTPAT